MKDKYQLTVGSPLDYEEIVVYIDINGKNIGLLQKEKGEKKLNFEIFKRNENLTVDYKTLINALKKAKKELLK